MGKENGCTVIVGCGRLGASIAGKLSEEKRDVIVIDHDKTSFRKLPHSYGGLTMVASATDMDRMMASDMRNAAVFIAVTDDDCVNICAAQIAKKMFHIPKVVIRLYDKDKMDLVKPLDIETICPSELSEKEIANYIESGAKKDVE